MITLKDVSKIYPMGKMSVDALKGVSLEFKKGDFIAVAGPSGSGKTTLMNIIGLIDVPTQGDVFIGGNETGKLSRRELTRFRREYIGFIFQSFNLLPVLNVFENVELPLVLNKGAVSRAERKERVGHLLDLMELTDRSGHLPMELSGGQQQRVAIARALVTNPKIVLADEPTANLDSVTGEKILEFMKNINRQQGTTFIFSTHDPDIWAMANHIVFLRDGAVESEEHR
ncbi:MAG: ABC transporter ATP-binding protein [Treponema sp.]|jgi:putative ABC transport system ATP-binding protein|nr:ABC transporter ATP-binding protein [Treponema sp.]